MKFVDEFRDPAAARQLIATIEEQAKQLDRPIKLMEICGGHTHTIYRYGLENLLPDSIDLVHGPGCPVCVIPMGRVDDALWLANQPDVILTTFGDMMRVPGSEESLLQARARGCDVRFVYSPLDSLKIAEENPDKHVIFFAIGFETTTPSTAVTLTAAKQRDIPNFSVFSNHVTIEPPLRAIANGGVTEVDGFIGPGHVATVVGTKAFDFLAEEFNRPVSVCGFEPLDILQGVAQLLEQFTSGDIAAGKARVQNQYARVVRPEGNPSAQALLDRVFDIRDEFEWRGLGTLPHSGMAISEEFAKWDAERIFDVPGNRVEDPAACECGSVLTGHIKPWQCKVFGTACTPDTPIGTCMVSPEGACAAYYNFGRIDKITTSSLS
ncbi:hydrogenase formation protein HypD [Corynebacterium sp. NML98-0116]|uniref:Hydrogenase formation protein HypD n=1 Tax=Corynebacterium pseudogenitalium TaxID=38303 RepID=A0ABD4TSR9_9CORY|nr:MULTISPECIES: hydrogenase formation protein HypD [Corynebacterium]AOX05680.1 hydrogenase formation protein HypD [Corynebacterium sp. NML98-0116]MCQ4608493.1 hydrogenase formation protein HypD [Corynebacterium pseudogenitalium]MCQ4610137.1 hydrogenase formation protein HypD [Corynebacterium sp. CCUG 61414]MCQ4612860.1 hydrogenase formation protein HypD [Corynebacterium sp. CCUG 51687]MCQ4614700.1 hydrogenase formation protein HypD [Corynebacterium pseudogenitalium]